MCPARNLRERTCTKAQSRGALADRAIGNLKQWLLGTHHGVGRHQLQAYLDEFVFRHNRRKQPMAAFQTLLGLGTKHKSTTYKEMRTDGPFKRPAKTDHNILWLAEQPDKHEPLAIFQGGFRVPAAF